MRIKLTRKQLGAALILLVAAGVLLQPILFPGDKDLIRQTVLKGCDLAAFKKEMHPLERLKRARQIAEIFTTEVSFQANLQHGPQEKIIGRQNLERHSLAAFTWFEHFKINIKDSKIEVNGDRASLTTTAVATGRAKGEAQDFQEALEVRLDFVKDGDWLISKVENINQLQK